MVILSSFDLAFFNASVFGMDQCTGYWWAIFTIRDLGFFDTKKRKKYQKENCRSKYIHSYRMQILLSPALYIFFGKKGGF